MHGYKLARWWTQVGSYAKAARTKLEQAAADEAVSSSLLQTLEREDENKGRQTLISRARRSASYSEKSSQGRRASSKNSGGREGGAGGPLWITDFSQALDQAVASDRPVFVTRRPQVIGHARNNM